MNCLFWNTGKKNVNSYIEKLVIDYSIDILCLAEYTDDKNTLLRRLADLGFNLYSIPKIGCERIDLFTTITPGKIKHLLETNYYTFKRLPHPTLGLLTFGFVHFPSKMYMSEVDFEEESRIFKQEVEGVEKDVNASDTILVGDFNMNPFEKGMMATTMLHAYPTSFEAKKVSRKIKHRTYKMFYNPMWSHFGDRTSPSGTYFYNSGKHYQLYWNMFDQVIYRPSLIDSISPENVKIITKIGNTNIINEKGIPMVSDHLPLYFEIS